MKAVSPLSLEPRDLLWLLEVEQSKKAAAQSCCVCVCAIPFLSGLLWSFLLCCALSLSQLDSLPTQWMSLEWLV